MDSKKDILWRVYLVYLLMLLFGLAIVVKMVYIQIKEGPELAKKAQQQEIRVFDLKADRGNILSDEGDLLATSVPVFEVRMDVANEYISNELFNSKVDSLAYRLSQLFGDRTQQEYERMLVRARKQGNRFLLIRRHVSYEQLKQIRTFPILRKGKNSGGLITFQQTRRELPFGLLAARTIGYTLPKEDLYVGLEGAYAKQLSGVNGKQIRRRINHGAWLPVHSANETQPQNGKDVVTTIDVNLQDVAEEALRKQLVKHEAQMGCAVLMSVKTGDIRAIANLSLNPKTGKYDESYNMAIGEKYEPGSTFKLASMIAALEDHKVKITDSVDVNHGYVVYYGRTLRDAHTIANGNITVAAAFEHSSNVGISRVIYNIYKDDPSKFTDHLYKLKLDQKLGLNIPGEAQPYIKNPTDKNWYLTSLPWMSVGYSLELTPLQLLTFYNGVANNGVEVKPRFVSEITEGGTVIKKFPVEVINPRMASPHTIKLVKELLRGVVENGTAQNLKNDHFGIAGKTGTAKISKDGKYIPEYNASFVGYFPADNPQYSCIVVVNKPQHGYYGSSVAAPVFEEIARKVYATSLSLTTDKDTLPAIRQVPETKYPVWYPDLKTIYTDLDLPGQDYLQKKEKWATTQETNNKVEFEPKDFQQNLVPNVRGMKAKDAVYLLENMGLNVTMSGKGSVYSQSLRPGTRIQRGADINIKLSTY
ncbi:MAG: transpeptidase family protein [Bacteroidales bacterium]|nr:transpeptidase family protein [Bacteroidales bacterium]